MTSRAHKAVEIGLAQTFVCLADELNFTATADRMNVTQQAVSAQIKRLEQLVGRTLVDRSRQKINLTSDGALFLVSARKIIEISEEVSRNFAHAPASGIVRIGFPPGLVLPELPTVLKEIRHAHPQLGLVYEVGLAESLATKLETGRLDMVIGIQRAGECRGRRLRQEKLVWVGSIEQLDNKNDPIPLIIPSEPFFMREHILDSLRAAGRRWAVLFESNEASAVRSAVQAGWGFSVYSEAMAVQWSGRIDPVLQSAMPDCGAIEIFIQYGGGATNIVRSCASIIIASLDRD